MCFQNRHELLKHIRLKHRNRQHHSCLYSNCPCNFKTLNALHIHLSRIHPKQDSQKPLELTTFSCSLCTCSSLSTEREFFSHLGIHFKSHETVTCVFRDCNYKTNIYGTFHSHKNRKHNPYTLNDFKPGIVTPTGVSQDVSVNADKDALNLDDSSVEANSTFPSEDVDLNHTLSDTIKENLAAALFKLEHFAHVPATKMDEFLQELHYLFGTGTLPISVNIIEDVLRKHGSTTDKSVTTEVATALSVFHPLLKAIGEYGCLSSSYLRNKFYRENFNVVEPIEFVLDGKENKSCQYVPILKNLQQILDRKGVVDKIIENHRVHQNNGRTGQHHSYKSYQDGSHFKENSFLSGDDLRLLLTLYIDDFEVCNPLGTSRRKHKLCGIYWTFSNLPPGSHSVLSSIYLAVLSKSDDMKKYGYGQVLQPLLHDLKLLEQHGIFVPLLGRCLKGTVQVVLADNLGAHSIAGFNENFTAGHICRFCTATRTEIQKKEVRSGSFIQRTKALHEEHVNSAQKDGSSCFGVKRECVITKNLAHFNVLSGYPPDIMHDLFEGVVPVELGQCLSVLISKKYFSLEHLNKSILGFPYKWSDKTNKPHAIPHTFSQTIRGNAHENWALLRFLPFIIGPLVPEDDKAWQILMALKDVVELLVAPTHTEESIAYLECKISEHRKRYQELFPHMQLLPKHHYLEHYPALIRKFGPLVSLWTMRFEAKHSYFKQIIRHSNCFKNVPLSLAVKHQLMMSYHMRASSFEKPAFEVTGVSTVPVSVLKKEIMESIEKMFPDTREVHLTTSVSANGVQYRKGMIVAHGSTSGLPDFGQIDHILVIQERLVFVVKILCGWYSEHHRAFELTACPTKEMDLIECSNLADDYPLADYFVGAQRMVTLKRYISIKGNFEITINSLKK